MRLTPTQKALILFVVGGAIVILGVLVLRGLGVVA